MNGAAAGYFQAGQIFRPASSSFAAGLGLAFFALCALPSLIALPGGEVTGGHTLMLLSLPVWFAAVLNRGHPVLDPLGRFAASAILACTIALIILAFLSAFTAEVPFRIMRPVVGLLAGPALLMLMIGTATRDRLYLYVSVLCLTIAATGALTILATAEPSLHARVFRGTDRASGFFKNPNQFGMVLTTILPVTFAMTLGAKKRRFLWLSAFAIMVVALMLSGSKTSILTSSVALFLMLLLYVFIRYSGPARVTMTIMSVFGALLTGSLLVIALANLNPRALRLLNQAIVEGEATHSLVSRSTLYRDSIELFMSNPLLGVGAGQLISGYPHSHNLILDYARTLGVPGVTFLLLLLIAVLVASVALVLLALRSREHPLQDRLFCTGLAIGPVAYLVTNMSSDSLGPTTSPYFFSTLALGLVARQLLTTSLYHMAGSRRP